MSNTILNKDIDKITRVLNSEGFQRVCESYNFNKVLYYKAVYTKKILNSCRESRLHLDLYNNGNFTLQGSVSREVRTELKMLIKDELLENKQLELFSVIENQ